jgi:hypothetical protein
MAPGLEEIAESKATGIGVSRIFAGRSTSIDGDGDDVPRAVNALSDAGGAGFRHMPQMT